MSPTITVESFFLFCRVRLMANEKKKKHTVKIYNEINSKLVICNLSFVTCAVLSLLFSGSALNSEHARTCSLTLFSDADVN